MVDAKKSADEGGKSYAEQIVDLEVEIAKLKAKQEELRIANQPKYPKMIQVPQPVSAPVPPTIAVTVNSEEEEKRVLAAAAEAVKAAEKEKK